MRQAPLENMAKSLPAMLTLENERAITVDNGLMTILDQLAYKYDEHHCVAMITSCNSVL